MSVDSCAEQAGKVVPRIDRNRCEGKAACASVCPFEVFEIRTLAPQDRASLSLRGRLKAWAHGGKQAYVARPDACHACGRCIAACPEKAITLQRAG